MNEKMLFAILLLAPVIGFVINGLRWKSKNYMVAGSVATGAAALSFLSALTLVLKLFGEGAPKSVAADFFIHLAENIGHFGSFR